jgi:hypothetical protein
MSEELKAAKRYRDKAQELRALAGRDTNPETRTVLIHVAENYEQMARNMETLHIVSSVLRERRNSN